MLNQKTTSARRAKPTLLAELGEREWEVARLAALGYSNREIATELKITEQIVKNVLHSVFDRVGVWNRVELANRFPKGVERTCAQQNSLGQPLRYKPLDSGAADTQASNPESGMELRDLLADPEFPLRKKPIRREGCIAGAYQTLARVFAECPDVILQRLVDAAIAFCGADSAGISLEEGKGSEPRRFRWIAISGSFASFLGGTTPRFFSPCGTTLDCGRPQLYRVGTAYYNYLGIEAAPITDGMLIPWQAAQVRGTLWVVSHKHREAFDLEDFKLIEGLADFASMAVENSFRQAEPQPSDETYPAKQFSDIKEFSDVKAT